MLFPRILTLFFPANVAIINLSFGDEVNSVIIEATNGPNWGKFMVSQFREEWSIKSVINPGRILLRDIGWDVVHLNAPFEMHGYRRAGK